ncbi:MAG: diguanylate cyclase [Thermoanaerobaculia bacterium]
MNDVRVERYRQATEAMQAGQFDVPIPIGEPDEVSRLGVALQRLAQTLETRTEQAARLAAITQKVNEGLVLEDVLDLVYESFRSLIPYDRIGLSLMAQEENIVRARWARSEAREIRLQAGYASTLGGSSLEKIIKTGKPRILNDLEDYLEKHPQSDSTRRIVEEGMRSSLTCPLIALGKPFGFLFFSSMNKNAYNEVHQDFFLEIAGQLSVILEKSRLYQDLLTATEKLQEAQVALEHQATRDSLTELWNRRSVLDLLKREMARASREERPLAAVMVDIDHFKRINDEVGHLVGDEVLRELTRRVGSCLRSADILGRLGGEEFLIVLYPGDEKTALEVMERARQACAARPIKTDNGEFVVTVSLGAAVVEHVNGLDVPTVLRTADSALYRAKNEGRNRSIVESVT